MPSTGCRVPATGAGHESCALDLLKLPRYVLAEDLTDQEEVVDRVEGVHDAGPADRVRLLCARLCLNHPPLLLSLPLESLRVGGIMVKHGYGSRG